MLIWTSIAVFILSINHIFDRFSALVMIILQYAISMWLVFLSVWLISFIDPVLPSGYFEAFRSFTLFYVIGAGVYYIDLFKSIKTQNKLLKEIQNNQNRQDK